MDMTNGLGSKQFTLILERLIPILSQGWTCPRCKSVWSPTHAECDNFNLMDRLDGIKK